jgi:TolB protein
MISKPVRVFANRPYTSEYRRFAKNLNPAREARIWPQMGLCNSLIILRWIGCVFLCLHWLLAHCDESFDSELEKRCLLNIQQLTFPNMGFEKAGEAYFSPDGKKMIFQAIPEGERHFQIFTMDLEDKIPFMVSTGKGACTCGNFRPDGKKIIFASSHNSPENQEPYINQQSTASSGKYTWDLTPYMNIYEANPDGSELKALTSGNAYHAECTYSRNGLEIVYASNQDGSMNLYVMKADGSDVRQITHTQSCYNGGPFFSPEGDKIIFRADRERADFLQIFLINADGTNERQLTFNEAVNWAPYWHPNGKTVAYTTSIHGHKQYEIYLLDVLTKAEYRLTYNSSFDGLPAFSFDGEKILWTSKRGGGASQVFIADFIMPQAME